MKREYLNKVSKIAKDYNLSKITDVEALKLEIELAGSFDLETVLSCHNANDIKEVYRQLISFRPEAAKVLFNK